MTHQVKAGPRTGFGQVWKACGGKTLPMALFLSSLQILAVSHLAEVAWSGYRQTLATSLVLQPCRICKPSIPTSPVYVPTAIVLFFSHTEKSGLWLCSCFISYQLPFVGRFLVSAHSYSAGTVDTELGGLQ